MNSYSLRLNYWLASKQYISDVFLPMLNKVLAKLTACNEILFHNSVFIIIWQKDSYLNVLSKSKLMSLTCLRPCACPLFYLMIYLFDFLKHLLIVMAMFAAGWVFCCPACNEWHIMRVIGVIFILAAAAM